jgi:hypothetical protein
VSNVLMLIAAIIGLAQFGAYYWRSLIAARAARPLSERYRLATGSEYAEPRVQDFGALLSFYRLTPGLKNRTSDLCGIRVYYSEGNLAWAAEMRCH